MIVIKDITLSQPEWDEIVNASQTATFFQSREWLTLWLRNFGGKERILGVFDGETLVGIVPLYEENGTLGFLGLRPVLKHDLVSDFGDIVARISYEEVIWKEVFANLPSASFDKTQDKSSGQANISKKKVIFNFIREDSPSFRILQDLGGKAEEVDVAPYINLPTTWEEYLSSLDRKDRHELKRKIRRLEEQGAFKVCHVVPAGRQAARQEGVPLDIDEFLRLMALSTKQKRNFLSEEMKAFFRDMIMTLWKLKLLSLCFLKLGGVNIAALILFEYKDAVLLYNSGYDPAYKNLSPGLLLTAFVIKNAIEQGKKRFDFLRGGERYKYDLGGKERKLYKISF